MTAVEIAVQDAAGAKVARELDADRIELCSALALGGLTPSRGLIDVALEVGPEVHVLIRPRAGGFVYCRAELELMRRDIRAATASGAAGVVVGALTEVGTVDGEAVDSFVEAAGGAEVTFHRAIDVAADIFAAAQSLVGRGVRRILTSGGAVSADAGRGVLTELVHRYGARVQIQAGAGIGPDNARRVADTGVAAVHFSATRSIGAPAPAGAVDFGGFDTIDADLAGATIRALRA